MSAYLVTVLAGYLAAIATAFFGRSRAYGLFAVLVLAFPTWVGLALRPHLGPLGEVVPYLQLITYLHFSMLVLGPRMRPWPVRLLINWPALWFAAATFVALPWAIASGLGLTPYGAWVPFLLCAGGVLQSLVTREETVALRLDCERDAGPLRRFRDGLGAAVSGQRPLRIVQITDPHLGPFMSVARLRRICERAVAREPDLILITGDLMTMESQSVEVVRAALAPLAAYRGRVFACHGNHDLEAREVVATALADLGIALLIDDAATVATPAGPAQIVGADFVWQGRGPHLRELCARCPREPGAWRIVLLHDPGGFRYLPDGEADLVLSGHTHGGHVGLLSFGLIHTFVSLFSKLPDHGPWAQGRNRMYVHRAQGVYGFPIRLGVPGEQSLLEVWR
ncbi:MAG: hypothetical protein Tsb0020_20770 [Haliangiales bacterium]